MARRLSREAITKRLGASRLPDGAKEFGVWAITLK